MTAKHSVEQLWHPGTPQRPLIANADRDLIALLAPTFDRAIPVYSAKKLRAIAEAKDICNPTNRHAPKPNTAERGVKLGRIPFFSTDVLEVADVLLLYAQNDREIRGHPYCGCRQSGT
jgi:hypothetical protein